MHLRWIRHEIWKTNFFRRYKFIFYTVAYLQCQDNFMFLQKKNRKNNPASSIFSWKRTMSKKKKKIILTEIFLYFFFSIKRNDFTKCIVKNCVLPLQLVEMCPYLFSISQWSRNKSICAAALWHSVEKWKTLLSMNNFFVKSSL